MVPRAAPKIEQYLRGARAQELGLARLMSIDGPREPAAMARAIRELPAQQLPSQVQMAGLLDGKDNLNRLVGAILRKRVGQRSAL